MTERFTLTNPKNAFQEMKCGINDKDTTLTFNEVVDMLNVFNDEHEQLKEERNYFERKKCEYFNKYNKKHLDNIQLKKENEQLKQEIETLQEQLAHIDGGMFE